MNRFSHKQTVKKSLIALTLLGYASLFSGAARADDAALKKQIDSLEARQRVLERKQELDLEERAKTAKESSTVSAGKNGFSLQSADGKFQLKLKGLVQADARVVLDDETPNELNTFLLRRVRPSLEGTLYKNFSFRILPDFAGGNFTLLDAYIDAKIRPEVVIRAGKFKEPVGLERLQSIQALTFVEFALPTNLVPNRDAGVQVSGDIKDGLVSYAVGAFNGTVDAGSNELDINNEKDITARLFAHPFKTSSLTALEKLGVGISGTYGDAQGTAASSALPSYRSSAQQTFFRYRSDGTAAGTVVADGARYRLSPQAYYYYGPFGVLGEYVLSNQHVNLNGAEKDLNHHAWQVTTSYVIGGDASYTGVKPRQPFSIKEGNLGAVELAARYHELRIDDDTFPTFANPAQSAKQARSFGAGVNWYLNQNVRLATNFEYTGFEGGNTGNTDRPSEKALFSRLQLNF